MGWASPHADAIVPEEEVLDKADQQLPQQPEQGNNDALIWQPRSQGGKATSAVFGRAWRLPPAADSATPPSQASTPSSSSTSKIRVMSFNLLADGLARGAAEGDVHQAPIMPEMGFSGSAADALVPEGVIYVEGVEKREGPNFFRCPQRCLAWENRYPGLKKLMFEHNPDVIGLQELDLEQDRTCHVGLLLTDMQARGYTGVTGKKLGKACDGLGIFWRSDRLEREGEREVWRLGQGCHVALAQRLRVIGGSVFLAVAVHLKAGLNAEAECVREAQAEELLLRLRGAQLPCVVLADTNAHCRHLMGADRQPLAPKVYPHLVEGGLRSAYAEVCKELGDDQQQQSDAALRLWKNVEGASAAEPNFTCWCGWHGYDVIGVFDYIFVMGRRFHVRNVLEMPSAFEVLRHDDRLPNEEFPSDHIPLVADLELVPAQRKDKGKKRAGAGAGAHDGRWVPVGTTTVTLMQSGSSTTDTDRMIMHALSRDAVAAENAEKPESLLQAKMALSARIDAMCATPGQGMVYQ
eukprot:TRINITY_DN102009_c0_g1_i1.p1 TRINITY_DN102009_c0_g1~~TRINITY_DN102009_c0_g1_i1.p1  ORF type:complete len:521 (-),score=95.57 TRINITY_DN102009_c0_g1_i1:133-1695(-)